MRRTGMWADLGREDLGRIVASLEWEEAGPPVLDCKVARPVGTELNNFVNELWGRTASRNRRLHHIEVLRLPHKEDCVRSYFRQVEAGRGVGGGPLNPENFTTPDFQSGLAKLLEHRQTTGRMASYVLSWHGTTFDLRYTVASGGLQPLRSTDGGYFGGGSYTTLNANYAAEYSELKPPGPGVEYAVLLVATCVGCAYVITRGRDYSDQTSPEAVSNFYGSTPDDTKYIKSGYDTHFVPVKTPHNQACPTEQATSFEVVSRETVQCCPIAICYYKKV